VSLHCQTQGTVSGGGTVADYIGKAVDPRASGFTLSGHTVGTLGAAAGMSEFELMQLLGHKTAATTRRYVQTVQEVQRKNIETIGNVISAMGEGDSAEIIAVKGKTLNYSMKVGRICRTLN